MPYHIQTYTRNYTALSFSIILYSKQNMIQLKYIVLAITHLLLVSACESNATAPNVTLENLQVEITLVGANESNPNGDGSGKIEVTAFEKNAVRYAFRFDKGDLIESESGRIAHTFTAEGLHSHTIVVWAYAESGQFVNKTFTAEVYKSNEAPSDDFTTLVFFDEFDYEGALDDEKWFHQTIAPENGGWFNGEQQHYTDRLENSFVSEGTLKIKAIKENYTSGGSTKSYTSARLNSKFAFQYGRVEVRAKLPTEPGTWPAIWTLGANINEVGNYFGDQYGSVGWPACGEIDIMEQTGADKSKTLGYFHWGDTNTGEYKTTGNEIAVANTGEYHVYGMVWTEEYIRLTVDDRVIIELSNTQDKPFDNPHYLLLNIAMGGNLGGEIMPDFTEATFEIDYVRIYQ